MSTVIQHDPSAVLDYTWNWSGWLEQDETITDHTVTAPAGLTVDESTADGRTVTAWLSASSSHGRVLRVVCHITTSKGRQDDRSHQILVTDR